ncbi:MAG TPA: glycosyltransferase, partial [Nitrospiraceae bacterium]
MSALNDDRYGSFSSLLRKTFDEALDDFDPSEVDLLHIDGLHTYEAVSHDFESWLPKMSPSGVVLLHDTYERKADFGVHRFLTELKDRFPVFEFKHGHGLGVVGVGNELDGPVMRLVSQPSDSPDAQLTRDLYAALGARLALKVAIEDLGNSSAPPYRGARSGLRLTSGAIPEEVDALRSALATQTSEADALRDMVEIQERALAEQRGTMALLQQEVEHVLRSTSWRITRPIRIVGDTGRRLIWRMRQPTDQSTADDIKRLYRRFDPKVDRATRRTLREHLKRNPALRGTEVSIVMPTHDRGYVIGTAIKSVLAQTHKAWELLIIDDGSTDDTEAVVQSFHDQRIRYLRLESGSGIGPARNEGLRHARGELIAYLDSDNVWDREFLALTVAGLDMNSASIGYSATELVEGGKTVGFRGDRFDFALCLDANYIDINSFCHRRNLVKDENFFDPQIRRTSDWDFILRITYGREAIYLPFVGVRYSISERPDQITLREPYVYRNLVE